MEVGFVVFRFHLEPLFTGLEAHGPLIGSGGLSIAMSASLHADCDATLTIAVG